MVVPQSSAQPRNRQLVETRRETPDRLRMAWAVAVAADALQVGAFPLFAEGAISPLDSVLDLVVAFMLIRLVGWHWAFLPTIVAEALPGADLFPTWTAALLFVSHDRSRSGAPEVFGLWATLRPREGEKEAT